MGGEAEYSIMKYIRERRSKWSRDATVCIASQDTDVVLLALQNRVQNCFILNYPQRNETLFAPEFINIDALRYYLGEEFGVDGKGVEQVVDDQMLMMSLLGNDFIPTMFAGAPDFDHLQQFERVNLIMERCHEVYSEAFVPNGRFLTNGDDIVGGNFGPFLEELGKLFRMSDEISDGSKEASEAALERVTWIYRYSRSGKVDLGWTPGNENANLPSPRVIAKYANGFVSKLVHDDPEYDWTFDRFPENAEDDEKQSRCCLLL
jgi:hypothetical protein